MVYCLANVARWSWLTWSRCDLPLEPWARFFFFFLNGVSTSGEPSIARSGVIVDVDVADAVVVVAAVPAAPTAPAVVHAAASIIPAVRANAPAAAAVTSVAL
eukprot:CAMPEP_0171920590 /NCGR_PEP_ID=MMETSP0993-20121228/19345_1 /TAXON_ID=483369 /ORGANISM="non described non described, Strain CCMP2098" /LENGTH=101 /DNA_ID=CAMNT_0012557657 /DNA_START=46 /DNA_END=347 /DNA_ORIENTATION=+